ncbi:uncharacterized protein LOC123321665 [Coccinella septempunctata]|uniref:uncharacterized protein LOC123321665 n=1 Tax=Coccinella septempunctata TaxID=41139 RepID=UPI001D08657B|nr:uncharacterized protein LOC123321665 [Coccinella septempunctata]
MRILNLGHKFSPIPRSLDVFKTAIDIETQVRNNPHFDAIAEEVADTLRAFKDRELA